MKELYLKIYHPELHLLSQITLNELIKDIGKLVKKNQLQLVNYIIDTSTLSFSEKQSIHDRVKHKLDRIPVFYIDDFKKNSVELTLSITAVCLWILSNTIGETLKDAYKESKFHKYIRKILLSKKVDDFDEEFFQKIKITIFDRRFTVKEAQKFEEKDKRIINIELESPKELLPKDVMINTKINRSFVDKKSKEKIEVLSREKPK